MEKFSKTTRGLLIVGTLCLLGIVLILAAAPHFWKDMAATSDRINFVGFIDEAKQSKKIRKLALVSVENFIKMAADPDTVVLDTRSKAAYDFKHIKGAVHLNFSDITKSSLDRVIPNRESRILIYCNNNFLNDSRAFPSKTSRAALNIPTFITLNSYGYDNVFELGAIEDELDTLLEFEGRFNEAEAKVGPNQ